MKTILITIALSIFTVFTYSQTTVDHVSGTAQVHIPLVTIGGQTMTIPIALSHNTSGVKVNDIASWVGTGWDLTGGGQVSRLPNGLPDEAMVLFGQSDNLGNEAGDVKVAGYLWSKDFYRNAQGEYEYPLGYDDRLALGAIDLTPDEFYVSAPGLQARFVFTPNEASLNSFSEYNAAYRTQSFSYIVVPFQNLKIECNLDPTLNGTFTSFVVTNEQGYKYYFTRPDKSQVEVQMGSENLIFNDTSNEEVCNNWLLEKIENPHGVVEVEYFYIQNEISSSVFNYAEGELSCSGQNHHIEINAGSYALAIANYFTNNTSSVDEYITPCELPYRFFKQRSYVRQKISHLSKIVTQNQEVSFVLENQERQDLAGDFALSKIVHKVNGEVVSQTVLNYDYWNCSSAANVPSDLPLEDTKRLKLTGVLHLNGSDMVRDKGKQFEYDESIIPPPRNAFAQDYWGYYNAADNDGLIPHYPFNHVYNVNNPQAIRQAGIGICTLVRIINELGGFEQFEFDRFEYSSASDGPVDLYQITNRQSITVLATTPQGSCNGANDDENEDSQQFNIHGDQIVTLDIHIDPETNCQSFQNCSFSLTDITVEVIMYKIIGNGQPNQFIYSLESDPLIETFFDMPFTNIHREFQLSSGSYVILVKSKIADFLLGEITCGNISATVKYWNTDSNQAASQIKLAGGNRLTKLLTSDGDADQDNDIVRSLKYHIPVADDLAKSSGYLLAIPNLRNSYQNFLMNKVQVSHNPVTENDYGIDWIFFVDHDNTIYQTASYSVNPIVSYNGSSVMYSKVTEYIERIDDIENLDESLSNKGKIVRDYYITEFGNTNEPNGQQQIVNLQKNAALRSLTEYNSENEEVLRMTYEYDEVLDYGGSVVKAARKELSSIEGTHFLNIHGIDPETIDAMKTSAIVNSGTALVMAIANPPSAPLAVAACMLHAVNLARAYALGWANPDITYVSNDNMVNYHYSQKGYSYHSSLFRLSRVNKYIYDPLTNQFGTQVEEYTYSANAAVNDNGFKKTTTQPVTSVVFCDQNQGVNYGKRIQYLAEYNCQGCISGQDAAAFGIKTLQSKGLYNAPVEVLQLQGADPNQMYVIGGTIVRYAPDESFSSLSGNSYVGFLIKETYILQLEEPILLSDFEMSEIDGFGNFQMDDHYKLSSVIDSYDEFFKPNLTHSPHDINNSVLRSKPDGRVIMQAMNAAPNQIHYLGFEDYELASSEWSFGDELIESSTYLYNGFELYNAKSGRNYYGLAQDIEINIPQGDYTLNFWSTSDDVFVSASGGINSVNELIHAADEDVAGWKYYEFNVYAGSNITLTIEGNAARKIDEIRIYPKDALVSTIQYNNLGLVVSTCNANGECVYYGYDPHLRPRWVLDNDRNARSYTFIEDIQPADPQGTRASVSKRIFHELGMEYQDAWNLGGGALGDATTGTTYFDGLGRPIQSVLRDASGGFLFQDIIAFHEYDKFGQEPKRYLPYAHSNAGHLFRENAKSEQATFYQQQEGIALTDFAFSETVTDNTPMLRPIEQSAPGEGFDLASGHTIKSAMHLNRVNEVRAWVIDPTSDHATGSSFWPAKTLIKSEFQDENGKTQWVFSDMFGRTILKRIPVNSSGINSEGKHFTDRDTPAVTSGTDLYGANIYYVDNYYVYDDFGRLAYEVTPLMMEQFDLSGTYSFSPQAGEVNFDIFNGLGNAWRYDARGRLIESKTPGAGWTYNIYNEIDQLVMSQDAQQRMQNQWSYIRYDVLGRVIITGVTSTAIVVVTREQMQANWDGEYANLWERRTTAVGNMGYTNLAPYTANDEVLTVNYYDNYDFDLASAPAFDPLTGTNRYRGRLIGTKSKVLETTDQYITSVYYFDKRSLTYRMYEDNAEGGHDVYKFEYDFDGKMTQALRIHLNLENQTPLRIYQSYQYDPTGRLKRVFQRTGPDTEPLIQLVQNEYNILGQMAKRHLHKAPDVVRAMQVMDYRYNTRGWLTKINNSNLADDGDNLESDDVFGEEIMYFKPDPNSHLFDGNCDHQMHSFYNGLPGAIKWNTNPTYDEESESHMIDGTMLPENSYVYRYDDLYRMTAGLFASEDLTMSNFISECNGDYGKFEVNFNHYSELVNYDMGGNILHLERYKPRNGEAVKLDDLEYSYFDHSNRLKKIQDFEDNFGTLNDMAQYIDGTNLAEEFQYDPMGNLLSNADRALTFQYNTIGLTKKVSKAGETEEVLFTYDATGRKLRKQVGGKTWYYVNGVEYYDDGSGIKLIQIANETGCVRPKPADANNTAAFVYDYYITDHLGNIRVIFTDENAIVTTVVATIEPAALQAELDIFDGIIGPNVTTPNAWPTSAQLNTKVARLSASGYTIGPSRLMAVKTNDRVQVEVESFYEENDPGSTTGQTISQILGSILLNLGVQGLDLLPPGESAVGVFSNPNSAQTTGLINFLNQNTNELTEGKPQSFLVYILFDKNMNIDNAHSGVVAVGDANQLALLQTDLAAMPKEGYFYTYVTNQAQKKVYFNNLTVHHSRGRIRQINEYYPYGLTWSRPEDSNMRAYQSKSYQQNEWTTSGMELYDFHARMYDPVIGRWHAPDPMNQFDSPYNAMADNPVVSIDPDGMRVPTGGILGAIGFMGRLTMVRKMTETTSRDLAFEEVLGFKDNGVSSALQFIGAALAFNEGSQILSEGQHALGAAALSDHIGTASLYISRTILIQGRDRLPDGSVFSSDAGKIFIAGEEYWIGDLSAQKVSIVEKIVQINEDPNGVTNTPQVTINRKIEILEVMVSSPVEMIQFTDVDDFSQDNINQKIDEFITRNLSADSEASSLMEVGQSVMSEVTITFEDPEAISTDERSSLQKLKPEMQKKLRSSFGNDILKLKFEFKSNLPGREHARITIDSKRITYTLDPAGKYYSYFRK
jgi:RHS repeat-associated protein